jgi:hypothetical protein
MKKNLEYIAFHEAGHAVAHILAGIPFKYVTIKEAIEKDENGERSLGHIRFDKTKSEMKWDHIMLGEIHKSTLDLQTISLKASKVEKSERKCKVKMQCSIR